MTYKQLVLLEELKNHLWPCENLTIVFQLDNKLCTGNFSLKNKRNEAIYYTYKHNLYDQGFRQIKLLNDKFYSILSDFKEKVKNIFGDNIEIVKVLSDFKELAFTLMIETIKDNTNNIDLFFNEEPITPVIYNYKELNTNIDLTFFHIVDQQIMPVSLIIP